MLINVVTKRRYKVLAIFMAVNLIAQIGFPTVTFALTSGPSQPEAGSFEPVNTNQMVDLFTGDFTYNIPLLNVPGPNGGYPINLAYHAGIGMEQEASWVGLGWNINAGVISRNLRGMPDDFKGDGVNKTVHMKPQRRLSIGVGANIANVEAVGMDAGKGINVGATLSMYYDNYKGVGTILGMGLSTASAEQGGGNMQGSLSITSDSKEGLGISPSLSYSTQVKNKAYGFELGLNMHSRQGLKAITFNATMKTYDVKVTNVKGLDLPMIDVTVRSKGAGVSFSSSTFVPGMDMPRGGFSGDFDMKFGADKLFTDWGPITADVRFNENKILENSIDFKGYGYLYATDNVGYNIADFNREKDVPVNKNSKSLPIPSATYDVFSVKGQGVGGAFRTYRSDVGVFKDPMIASESGGGGFGGEFNIGTPTPPLVSEFKFGMNPTISVVSSYSGPWLSHADNVTDHYKFKQAVPDIIYEPAYFKGLGEMVASNKMQGGIQNSGDEPFRFELGLTWNGDVKVPVVRNIVNINDGPSLQVNSPAQIYKREKRAQSIQYLTSKEVATPYAPGHSFNNNGIPGGTYSDATPYAAPDHHLEEISVINADGNRYVYNLPAYNLLQRDIVFSVEGTSGTDGITTGRKRGYDNSIDNTVGNDKGMSNMYSATTMDPYAHSHLLTEVLSPDYVDVTGDGPSDDDLGYWVKFNYIDKNTSYKWRAPYYANEGNNIENKFSNDYDDMAGYSYGEKEIMYLESIETKTHVAEYYMSTREDGLGVAGENGGQGGVDQKLLKLDKIELKSKADLSKPIKTVHFQYNYTLCANTPNSNAPIEPGAQFGQGKLTLEKVWFTYLDNNMKGGLSPYEFVYGDTDHDGTPDVNPPYDINQMDRWGNYQVEGPFAGVAPDQNYSYCNQLDDYTAGTGSYTNTRSEDASAWNLTQVIMPSGGNLNIDYESDDYAYVQNKAAMQMFKIIGTSESGTTTLGVDLSNDDERIYFDLGKIMTQNELSRCLAGIDKAYFKSYMELKNHYQSTDKALDYVEGYTPIFNGKYAPVFNGNFGFGASNDIGWIKVDMVPPGQLIQSDIHPFKLAALRELRFNRTDILSGQNTALGAVSSLASIAAIFPLIVSSVQDAMQMISGFYNFGIMSGWCDKMVITDAHPSYIRLNTPDGVKYGGGCRVKAVDLSDNWSGLNGASASYENSTYGQVYDYTLEDRTTSSGVAEYEPLIGGEENPFRQPIRYSSDRLIFKDNALMIEEPYNESLFPSANVGYSRVTVRNRVQKDDNTDDVKKAVSGITINEFYTARDYPVYTKNTGVDHEGYNLTIPIPLIGSYVHHNNGYSQGFSIELNNMHGKPYSVATYAMPLDETDPKPGDPGVEPIAATSYYYKTQGSFIRNKASGNKLDNTVNVLTGDAITSSVEIGKHVDTYVDMRENTTTADNMGTSFNMNMNITSVPPAVIIIIVPTGMGHIDNTGSMFRSVTTNKVITRNGIFDQQVTTKEGAQTVTQNLYYDAETGSPLMRTTTNDFKKPIYDYTFAAHWEHEGMQGAYQNVGAVISNLGSTMIQDGDEVLDLTSPNTRYWIKSTNPLVVEDGDGAPINPAPTSVDGFKIVRSGYRNQQSVPSGNIVSLTNPIAARIFPLFTVVNSFIITAQNGWAAGLSYSAPEGNTFKDCMFNGSSDPTYTITDITITNGTNSSIKIGIDDGPGGCFSGELPTIDLVFNSSVDFTDPNSFDVTTMNVFKFGNKVKAVDGNGVVIWGELIGAECLNECLDGILHASSAKFNPSWGIDYADAGAVYPVGHPSVGQTLPSNTSRYGAENIWRLHETYLFDIDRKQSLLGADPTTTQTGLDGTYEVFALFNWSQFATNNAWTRTNTINQYSPYGFELENEDALNIKSAAMYGYSNSVVTAVASNTAYKEMVFDGFAT